MKLTLNKLFLCALALAVHWQLGMGAVVHERRDVPQCRINKVNGGSNVRAGKYINCFDHASLYNLRTPAVSAFPRSCSRSERFLGA